MADEFIEHAPGCAQLASGATPNLYTGMIARLFCSAEPFRVVAFTCSSPGEGVTWTVNHLRAELERTTGLRATVVSASDLVAEQPQRNQAWPDHTTKRYRQYDAVLVDAGSLAGNGSIIGLTRMVDAVVIVVAAGKARKEDIANAVTTIDSAQGRVAGFVFNKQKKGLPAWLEKLLG